MNVIGVDIGLTGALCVLRGDGRAAVVLDLPTVAVDGKGLVRRRLDARALMAMLREAVPIGEQALAVIEDVHTMPGRLNSPQSQGSLLHSRGVVETVLELARWPVHGVSPQRWKRFYGLLGKGKDASLHTARTLYPSLHPQLRRAMDHNRADAVLLAHYGSREFA